jgi:hypothetical protein
VDGLATGVELRGPDTHRPRDWALVGEFEVTDALSGEVTCASRLFHKQPRFFHDIKPGLEKGQPVAFAYDFLVKWIDGAVRTRIEFTRHEVVDSVTAERRLSKARHSSDDMTVATSPFARPSPLGSARPRRPAASDFHASRSTRFPIVATCPRHGPQSLANGFRPPPAPPCPPDGGMTALDPRLSLAPGMIRGRPLALRAAASSLALEASPGAFDHRLDRPLDPKPPIASSTATGRRPLSARGDRLLVPDCDQGLNSYRVSLRRPPAADRGAGSGIAARLAISRGMSRLLSGSPRGF